ncbi:cadmium-translocating P-type ATPase [Intestinimonas sp. MSJ-38]|nr:cadmium-translocating P-type ATPase [Intestinimonas sp. MSJ-38]
MHSHEHNHEHESCGCGHDHGHDHEHESCGCGHDHGHDHEHESCGCGHDHGHNHEHESCGCGHDHGHDHEHESCGCGHDHGHDHEHESCGCGHDHGHDHEHESCGCGHDHGHDHEHESCGCGHDHGHDHEHESCGCGHDHGHDHEHESCGCGHDHGHDHEHESCGCGHDHGHDHEHESCGCGYGHGHGHDHEHESCGCGHDHGHEHHHHHHHTPSVGSRRKVYIIDGLDCANCAAKIERKINQLEEVEEATLTFATKQLRVTAKDPDALLSQMLEIARSVEGTATITPRGEGVPRGMRRKTYRIDGLDCANCAAKIEGKINQLEEVEEATLTFATKQLRVTAKDPDALLPRMVEIARSVEGTAAITPWGDGREIEKEKKDEKKEERRDLLFILLGACLFVAGEVLGHALGGAEDSLWLRGVFLVSYVILGGEVLLTALKNLPRGHVFDENFLMSIATLGALCIGNFPEAVGVMLFYRAGEYFEHRAVEKSRSQIMEAVDLRPEVVERVLGEGKTETIPASQAQVGDILLVRPGDRIPLDGVVTKGESRIDTSPVTGEPVPVKVTEGSPVTSGCVNTSGLLEVRAEKVLEESMVTRILDSVENAAASKPKIDRFITRFARVYTPVVVGLALVTAILPSLFTGDWSYWIYTALTFLVISCPCALVLSVPLAFFAGIGAGSKKGILFKGGVSLEAMKNVKAVVMDKTGTITKGNFVLQQIDPLEGVDSQKVLEVAAICEQNSTHPIGVSILAAAKEKGIALEKPQQVTEQAGQGISAQTAQGLVLCGNRKLLENHGVQVSDLPSHKEGTQVLVALDGKMLGSLLIADTVKEESPSAIGKIKSQGIATVMLTGDGPESAQAVAEKTGVDQVFARLLPEEKLDKLQQVRKERGAVMFVGDGINDAPVLAGADVGAAMGSGADAAIEAADVVFMTSSMEAVPQSLAIARQTNSIAWQNVIFALAIKALVMVLGLFHYANMWAAVFADTGVAMLCVLNAVRLLYKKEHA